MTEKYIGLMSGTSIDGMDAVLVAFHNNTPDILASHSNPITDELRQLILTLCTSGSHEIEQMAVAEREIARLSAKTVNELLERSGEQSENINAIGSHGQTVRHLPDIGYTLQIGDPSLIAELTGITVVSDFRRRDIAAGGQGAPLVPAFHKAVFASKTEHRVIVNMGGISNLSILPANALAPVTGFDTGPGNMLMDFWCQKHKNMPFDRNGVWAASANESQTLLSAMMSDPFFHLAPPKSTGRERFNAFWLEEQLKHFPSLTSATVQATLCQLTVTAISRAIKQYAPATETVFVCGGGAKNKTLMRLLQSQLGDIPLSSTQSLAIDPALVESVAFAWLARQTLHHKAGNLPEVTGAEGLRVLGGIYPA
ncbi:anhydro-N-acetylmuramic acid kinase [Endozoicomonas sp.]|nr:anhydro-N-acetylmuramic acid kinase [Endozoicomonas sp.]